MDDTNSLSTPVFWVMGDNILKKICQMDDNIFFIITQIWVLGDNNLIENLLSSKFG